MVFDCEAAVPLVLVRVAAQQLVFFRSADQVLRYRVSTARNGVGCEQDSGCTPFGWHEIAEKVGDGAECGTIFKGRVANGSIAGNLQSSAEDDLITSRVLWLRGLELGINSGQTCDSYRRYIYIHGTAQEQLIGEPVSHGCVRMKNLDVIDLYDQVQCGDRVLIVTD